MHFLLVREFAWCCRKSRDRKIKHGNRQQTVISILFHRDVWLLLTRNHKYRRRKLIGVNLDSRREVLTTKADNANLRLCITYDQCQKPQTNLSRCCYCNFFFKPQIFKRMNSRAFRICHSDCRRMSEMTSLCVRNKIWNIVII